MSKTIEKTGPWTFHKSTDRHGGIVRQIVDDNGDVVVHMGVTIPDDENKDRLCALIAAGPELLGACEMLAAQFNHAKAWPADWYAEAKAAYDKALAAIAKATGKVGR